jgi:hypothetical protein
VVYEYQSDADSNTAAPGENATATGEALADMSAYTYGTPFAVALPDGDVLVVYYQGDPGAIGVRWARLALD